MLKKKRYTIIYALDFAKVIDDILLTNIIAVTNRRLIKI